MAGGNNTVTLTGGKQESETAWIVFGETEITPVPMLTFFGHAHTQKGLGRMHGGAGAFPAAGLTAAGKLELIEATAFYAGVAFALTPTTTISTFISWAKADENKDIGFTGDSCPAFGVAFGNCFEKHQSYHVALRHTFWERWRLGVGYSHFKAETFGGAEGDFNIVEAGIAYFF